MPSLRLALCVWWFLPGMVQQREQMERNLERVGERERRDQLISSLNELLYSELLAVKRTLGASHESQLIQLFREMQREA